MRIETGVRLGLVVMALVAGACAKVDKVEVTPATSLLTAAGQKIKITATAIDQNGAPMEKAKFEFVSSDTSVVTVDESGEVSAVRSGAADVTVKSGEKSAVAKIDVSIPAKLTFQPELISLTGLGSTAELVAKVSDDAGRPIPGAQANFSVENSAIGAITGKTVTAMSLGSTKITASFGALSAAADLTVALPIFAAISVEPVAPPTMKVGESVQLIVAAKSADGVNVAGVPMEFSSANAKVATVEPSGKIVAVSAGSTTVNVTSGDKTAAVKVSVK
jgi:uncharacterized protein YjdB